MRPSRREFVKWVTASGIALSLSRLASAAEPTFAARETRGRADARGARCLFTGPRRLGVPVGNLRSEILVVQSAQNWHRQRATDSLDGARDRRVLVQR
jgi:hypothetical protein